LAAEHGLAAVGRLFGGIRPSVWYLPPALRRDLAGWEQAIAGLPRLAELSRELGCDRVVAVLPAGSNERAYDATFQWQVERYRAIAGVLNSHGLRLGLEYLATPSLVKQYRYPFVNDLDGLLEFIGAIDLDNVGLLFDCFHWHLSRGTTDDFDRLTNTDVVHVHLNDAPNVPLEEQEDHTRCLPGQTGVIDIRGFLDGLRRIGYDGPLTVEPFNKDVDALPADEAVGAAMASLHKIGAIAASA
jgi:sugar phosphate isomerase/epimerase